MDESEILNNIVDLQRQLNKDVLMVRDLNEIDYDTISYILYFIYYYSISV